MRTEIWRNCVAAAALSFIGVAGEAKGAAPPDLPEIQCPEHEISGTVYCRALMVAEDRRAPEQRLIPIRIMVLAATGPSVEPDPLIIIPGGPGQSAVESPNLRGFFADYFAPIRARRDVVLVDQRGVGGSNPLSLSPAAELLYARMETNLPPEWARAALPALSARADLKQYTTTNAVEDLEAVRQAIDADRINIYATSYGTRVAQYYMKRYGAHVRAAILKGVSPPDDNIALSYGRKPQRALDLLFAMCAADAACDETYPDLRGQLNAVLTRLEAEPIEADASHAMTGAPFRLSITKGAFAFGIRSQMMNAFAFARLPRLIAEANDGDFSNWSSFLSRIPAVYATQLYGGMTLSIIASEDAVRLTEEAIKSDAEGTIIGDALARSFSEIAEFWPIGDAPEELFAPLISDIPILMVSGALDPATPPEGADAMLPGLNNGQHILFRGGSHSAANFDGLDEIMAEFIAEGSAADLDLSAVESNAPPPFDVGASD